MLPWIKYYAKIGEVLTYYLSVDVILCRHKEIKSIYHTLKTSGQYSIFYAKVVLMQIAIFL